MSALRVVVVRPKLSTAALVGRAIGLVLAYPLKAWAIGSLTGYLHRRYPAVPHLSFWDAMAVVALLGFLGLQQWDAYRWWTADPERKP